MIRGFLVALGAVVLAYGLGFVLFVSTLPRAPATLPHADGIVALTGNDARLDTAAALLDRGAANRLLVSGVDQTITRPTLKALMNRTVRFDCCVDIGYAAENTQGNAIEAATWVRQNGFKSLVLVTGRYHMPRAMREFHDRMPGVDLVAYPVEESGIDVDRWWQHRETALLLHREYSKYLTALLVTSIT